MKKLVVKSWQLGATEGGDHIVLTVANEILELAIVLQTGEARKIAQEIVDNCYRLDQRH